MSEIPFLSLLGTDVTVYSLLTALAILAAGSVMLARSRKKGLSARPVGLFFLLALLFGLLLGRGVYCAVRCNSVFFDELGDPKGWLPFFTLETGSVNAFGVLLGVLLGAWATGKIAGASPAVLLDGAALPGLGLFAFERLIEPLSGQGFVSNPLLCWPPLSIDSGWGDWSLSVSFIEAVLLLIAALFLVKAACRRPGTRALYALALIAGTQIIPEILRQDDVLLILIFGPVTQIGYAVLLLTALIGGLRSAGKKTAIREILLLLLGVALIGGGEFALDKSDWPPLLLYGVMILVLAAMTWMTLRRIRMHDCPA